MLNLTIYKATQRLYPTLLLSSRKYSSKNYNDRVTESIRKKIIEKYGSLEDESFIEAIKKNDGSNHSKHTQEQEEDEVGKIVEQSRVEVQRKEMEQNIKKYIKDEDIIYVSR